MEFITFKDQKYPSYQAQGHAAQWILPFAQAWCRGEGLDIGCNRLDWALPGAIPIDTTLNTSYDAYHLPDLEFDYVFSSHCLEHLADWVGALEYWASKLNPGGVLFLYLPHKEQHYWHPVNNRKHLHSFDESVLKDYYQQSQQWAYCQTTGLDLNHSFATVLIKR